MIPWQIHQLLKLKLYFKQYKWPINFNLSLNVFEDNF